MLLCDKPAGVTSHDVVAEVRRERGCKAGHAGTLDPFATGLLLVLLGPRDPRCSASSPALPKTYLATARLGWRSSTGDPDGELTETGRVPELAGAADRHRAPAGADDLGGPGRRRAPLPQGPSRRGRRDARARRRGLPGGAARPATARRARYEIECSAGHLRPDPDRDARGRLLLGAAADRDRARSAVEDAGARADRRAGRRAGPGRRRRRCADGEHRGHARCPTPSRGRATSRSAPSTASTAATRR